MLSFFNLSFNFEHMFFIVYIIFISVIASFITVTDKHSAKKSKRRISEKTLIIISLLGGSLAMLITMKCIHHKTRHKKFMIGIPVIIILQVVIIVYINTKAY